MKYFPFKILLLLSLLGISVLMPTHIQTSHNEAKAMWAQISDQELFKASELVVMAKLVEKTEVLVIEGKPRLSLGILQIEEVIKGNPQAKFVLLQMPSSDSPISSSDIIYRKNAQGLWFLRRRNTKDVGVYLADSPQRFVPKEKLNRS